MGEFELNSLAYTKSCLHAAQFSTVPIIINSFIKSFCFLWGLQLNVLIFIILLILWLLLDWDSLALKSSVPPIYFCTVYTATYPANMRPLIANIRTQSVLVDLLHGKRVKLLILRFCLHLILCYVMLRSLFLFNIYIAA
jgi:hypothetical protein